MPDPPARVRHAPFFLAGQSHQNKKLKAKSVTHIALEGPAPSGPQRLAGMARPEADDTEVIPPEVALRAMGWGTSRPSGITLCPWRDQLRLVRRRLVGMAQPEADDTEVIPPEVVLRAGCG